MKEKNKVYNNFYNTFHKLVRYIVQLLSLVMEKYIKLSFKHAITLIS